MTRRAPHGTALFSALGDALKGCLA
jgi:hypothetical protein